MSSFRSKFHRVTPIFGVLVVLGCGHQHAQAPAQNSKPQAKVAESRIGIFGTVRDARGTPVPGALVALTRVDSNDIDPPPAISYSAPDGSFSFAPLTTGIYALTATAKGKAGAFKGEVAFDAKRVLNVPLTLGDHGITYSGRVTDLRGRAIPALVGLYRVSNERGDGWYAQAGANGEYVMTVPDGHYAVIANAAGNHADIRYLQDDGPFRRADVEMMPDDVSSFAGASVVDELRAASVQLATCDPSAKLDDMMALARVVGNAHVVGLGEGAHGGHEIFQLKHRLFQFLVENLGFTVLGIEASWPDTLALNEYLLTGKGDVARLISGMRFWIWDTEELVELARWMRSYNAESRHARKLKFVGFDMQYAPTAVAVVRAYAARISPEWRERVERSLAELGDEFLASYFAYWPQANRQRVINALAALGREFEQQRDKWILTSGEEQWEIAHHAIEVLSQFTTLSADFGKYNEMRDRAMAQNVLWLLEHEPRGTKIALWAANVHLAKEDSFGRGPNMGALLNTTASVAMGFREVRSF